MALRDDIMAAATTFGGYRYRLDPPPSMDDGTIDCSLFVLATFEKAGIPLRGVRTAEQIRQATVPIGWDDVQPGDLLYFEGTYDAGPPSADGHIASHIGISLGRGTRKMYDAHERESSPDAVGITVLSDWWQPKLFEARRHPALVAGADTGGNPDAMPRGIDVSSNNGSIDWVAVAGSGVAFAWIKVTEDDGYLNPRFESDWLLAKRVGLLRGAYHFARPDQTGAGSDAVVEADWMLDHIDAHGGLAPGDLLALDLESGSGDLGQWALDFLHRCEERAGFKPFVYTAEWFSDPHEIDLQPELGGYPLWQASYRASMPAPAEPWSAITIWQRSDAGAVPGISGDVDLNVSTVPLDQLRALGEPGAAAVPVAALVDPIREQLDGLISAVAYLADDVAAIEDRDRRIAEARRVREQFVGARP